MRLGAESKMELKNYKLAKSGVLIAPVLVLTWSQVANAQRLNNDVMERVTWPQARREIQIIRTDPIIRYFPDSPPPGTFQLPSVPPQNASVLPPGGLPLGGGSQYPGIQTSGLPDARGFNGSNIPDRGLAPKSALPNGSSSSGRIGRFLTPAIPSGG